MIMIPTITQWSKPIAQQKWFFMSLILLVFFSLSGKAQTLEWARQMGEITNPDNNNMGKSVALDAEGNVYVTGNFKDTVDFDPGAGTALLYDTTGAQNSAYLAKYDAAGNYIWAKVLLMGGGVGKGVAVAADGSVYVTGAAGSLSYFETGSGIDSLVGAGIFLAKYDDDGTLTWMKGFSGGGSSYGCVVGRSGDVYISGTVSGMATDFNPGGTEGTIATGNANGQSNAFIAKYDASGNYIWAKGILGTAQLYIVNSGMGMAIDTTESADNIYITGCFRNGNLDFDPGSGVADLIIPNNARSVFLAKYDSSGTYIWANKTEASTPSSGTGSYGVAVDNQGNVLITGWLMGAADFDPGADTALVTASLQDMFLAKYDAEGNYTWAQATQGAGSICAGNDLAIDETGIIYVIGEYGYGVVDFDPGDGINSLMPTGFNMYVAKYGTCGTLLSLADIRGSSATTDDLLSTRCVLNKEGNLHITGGFRGNIDFDPGPDTEVLTGPISSGLAYRDIFLTKLHYDVDSNLTSFLTLSVCEDSFTLNEQTYTESGVYQQWLPGISQCDSIIVLDLTLNYIAEPVITVNEFELGVTNTYDTYQWIKEGEAIAGATSSTYLVTANGAYQVAVGNAEGCSDTSAIYIVDNVGINDPTGLGKQIQIYPNPASDVLYINSPVAVTALLYSVEGRLVTRVEQARSLSLKGLTKGMYLLQLTDKEGRTLRYEKIVYQPQ